MTSESEIGATLGAPERHAEEILASLGERRLMVLLDYDGTLSPIAPRPEDAVLPPDMQVVLDALGESCLTAVISGRALADVQALVGLEHLMYAGNHGLEIEGPPGSGICRNLGEDYAPEVGAAAAELDAALADIEGKLVENKRYSLSVHYRLVAPEAVPAVEAAVDEAIARHPRLRKRLGKKVYELRPDLDWNKGTAVRWLLEVVGERGDEALPVYVGDDVTDEDAFKALDGIGVGVLISEDGQETAATHRLRDTDEARRFLARLAEGRSR